MTDLHQASVLSRSCATTLLGVVALGGGAFGSVGCGDQIFTEGLEQPFSVRQAQFIEGALPGQPPLTTDQVQAGEQRLRPNAVSAITEVSYLRPHLANVPYFGWVTDDTVALAFQVEGQGDGYWVFPAGPPDPAQPGTLTWRQIFDFHEIPPGRHRLLVAAIDADGRSGTQIGPSLCINPPVPDNGNACNPTRQPPEVVVSLTWNTPVDLDLAVVVPNGDVIDAKSPGTGPRAPNGRIERNAPGAGVLDLDSNRECIIDGRQRENIVFQNSPLSGRYFVYVNLHDACGEAAVTYEASIHVRVPGDEEGTYRVREYRRSVGSLVALQANGSRERGTYVTSFVIGQ